MIGGIKLSSQGRMDRILSRWGEDSELKLTSHKNKKDVIEHLDEDYGLFGGDFFKND